MFIYVIDIPDYVFFQIYEFAFNAEVQTNSNKIFIVVYIYNIMLRLANNA